MISLEKLKEKAEIQVIRLDEDSSIKGNASAINPETDAKNEAHIIEQLNSGNEWAWCMVKVYAEIDGFKGPANYYLGHCSYKSRKDFMEDAYYDDMRNQALEDLKNEIEKKYEQFCKLIKDLS